MTRPRRFLIPMALFVFAVVGVAVLLTPVLGPAFLANVVLNGIITTVLLLGIGLSFREVWTLGAEIAWIEQFQRRERGVTSGRPPRLLTPLVNMLTGRQAADGRGRISLSPVTLSTLTEGIAARLDEQRETARYLIGTLVFLGLLGTFYGLLVTVRSVGDVVAGLSAGGDDIGQAMAALKRSLQPPLEGMGTAFSSSLFGLAGSLVLGFLDLQAGHAQNRFLSELEEWLSGSTRLAGAADGEGGAPAYVQALLERTIDGLDQLQRLIARGEEARQQADQTIIAVGERLAALSGGIANQNDAMLRIADALGSARADPIATGHLRAIEQLLARSAEQSVVGRDVIVQEMRAEIRLLARTIAALADESGQG